MKSIFKKTAIALVAVATLLASCKNPAKDVKIIVDTDIFKSPMLIQFVNAKKDSEGPKDFSVEIKGQNANLVVTPSGGKVFKASGGLLNLMLDRAANPTPNNPVKFTIIVNTAGFAPTFQDVEITSAADPKLFRVEMLEYNNPANGNGTVLATKAINNGVAASELTFSTATNASLTQKADITIASGTGFLDAAGQPIIGSQLEARIVYTGTSTDGKTPVATGGNFAKNVIDANGQPIAEGVYFYPVGEVTIDMFAGTKEVKNFTKPVNVDIEVNSSMINPNTNQPIQENETIPVWSLNQETGQWKNEGNGKIVKNTAGKLVARTQITHLSGYTMANIIRNHSPSPNPCNVSITINRPSADVVQLFDLVGPQISERITLAAGEKTKTIQVRGLRNVGAEITLSPVLDISSRSYYTSLTSPTYPNLCDQKIIFTYPPAPDMINVDVNMQFKCKNKELLTGINAFITVRPINSPSSQAMVYQLIKGNGIGSVINGVTYEIVTSIDGKSYTTQFTADKKDVQLSSNSGFSGNVTYDKASNTLKVVGLVSKDCN